MRKNTEQAKYDLKNGIAYYENRTEEIRGEDKTVTETVSYFRFEEGTRKGYYNENGAGWTNRNDTNYYQNFDGEINEIKFSLYDGYCSLEQMVDILGDTYFNNRTEKLIDMYESFSLDKDNGSYSYYDKDLECDVTVTFKDGYICKFILDSGKSDQSAGSFRYEFTFSAYGETKLEIPQEVIDGAVPKN